MLEMILWRLVGWLLQAKEGSERNAPGLGRPQSSGRPHWLAVWRHAVGPGLRKDLSVSRYQEEESKKQPARNGQNQSNER